MKKNKDRLKHAIHNEIVCNYLDLNKDFADWIITTSFYAALHYVSYLIFPFEASALGKKIIIENIDHHSNFDNPKRKSKHELLSDLVSKKCPAISEEYDWLLDMSMTARYKYYQHDIEIANKARNLMQTIKKKCVTKVELLNM